MSAPIPSPGSRSRFESQVTEADRGPEQKVVAERSAEVSVPETLPILPLKNTVIFPHLLAPLLVNTERSKKLIEM